MFKSLVYLLFVLFPFIAFAQNGEKFLHLKDTETFRRGVKEMAKNTKSIQTNFIQEKYLSILSNKISSSGSMYFKKPNYLKWSYSSPYNYYIILNNNEVTVSDEGKEMNFNISSSKLFKEINDMIINSIQGDILNEEKFTIEYFESINSYKVNLNPKEEKLKEYLNSIHLFFDKKDFMVSKIVMHESEEDYTLILFKDKQLNVPILNEKPSQ